MSNGESQMVSTERDEIYFFPLDYMNRVSERPETIGIRLCQRASMEDRGTVNSDMISPSSAG